MSVFTVFEPPRRSAGAVADPERFVFVRDGFYFWAFLTTWLWMLWHRMWIVLVIYIVAVMGVEAALHYSGVSTAGVVLAALGISLLIGMEASSLRRCSLARRRWTNVGVVSGEDLEDAERRFFDSWVRADSGKRNPPPSARPAAYAPASLPSSPVPDIVGLFPDPRANR